MLLRRVRQQRDRAGALEGRGERSLVSGARSSYAPGQDLAAVADEAPQPRDLLVVDVRDLLDAESADLAVLPLRSARTAWARSGLFAMWWTAACHGLAPKKGFRPGRRRAARRPERGCHRLPRVGARAESRRPRLRRRCGCRGTARRWR